MSRGSFPGRFSILLFGSLLLANVTQAQAPVGKSTDDLVNEARAQITEVTPATASEARNAGAVILDVREAHEYKQGHVPGAVNVPRGVLEFRIDELEVFEDLTDEARFDKPILVYCRSGKRSALATARLQEMGYADVKSIEGGYKAWIAEGLPVEMPGEKSER